MKRYQLLLLFLALTGACRMSRETVEIMDANSSNTSSHPRDFETAKFAISALSLPAPASAPDRVELSLTDSRSQELAYSRPNYKTGESIPIKPHRTYQINVRAFIGTVEIYSSKYCSGSQVFRSQEGLNTFTVSLCTAPTDSGIDP